LSSEAAFAAVPDYIHRATLAAHLATAVARPMLEVPVCILWGEENGWVAPSEGRRLAAMIPGGKLRLLPDAGHFSMVDCPGLFARELSDFLAALTGRGQPTDAA